MPDKSTEILEALHDIQERADKAISFLQAFVDGDSLPAPLRLEFLETQTALIMQKHAIRNMAEAHFEVNDQLEALIKQIS